MTTVSLTDARHPAILHSRHGSQVLSSLPPLAGAAPGQPPPSAAMMSMDRHTVPPSFDAAAFGMPRHEMALLHAQAMEESLLLGGPSEQQQGGLLEPLQDLSRLLASVPADDWNPRGRPDASGAATVGGSVALKLEELDRAVPGLGGLWRTTGRPKVVAVTGPVVAVGTSLGVVVVFQMNTVAGGPSSDLHASHPAATAAAAGATPNSSAASSGSAVHGHLNLAQGGHGHAGVTAPGAGPMPHAPGAPVAPLLVGEPRSEVEAVTALGFSHMASATDSMWLLVGHASGGLAVWDLQKRPARLVTTIAGQHNLPVTHASFFPGRGTSQAITSDRRGRLVSHTITMPLTMLGRVNVTSKPVMDGGLGVIANVYHLSPFKVPTADAALAAALARSSAGGAPAAGKTLEAAQQQVPDKAQKQRVGDGIAAVCSTTGLHITLFRSNGEMINLFSVPRAEGTRSGAMPTAAWLPHARRGAPPPLIRTGYVPGSQGESSVPCAILAAGWDRRVLFYEVPLLGDHRQAGAEPASTQPDSFQPAAAQPAAKRTLLRAVASAAVNATATAARAAAAVATAAPEPLSPPVVKQLSAAFPLLVASSWPQEKPPQEVAKEQQQPAVMDTDSTVLGLHWYDADAVGVVVHEGLSMRLVVVDPNSLETIEQVECFDLPAPSTHIVTSASGGSRNPNLVACPESVSGSGTRVVLLGQGGILYCSRLMPWAERLRTLQEIGKWRLGLWYGLEFYRAQQQRKRQAAAALGPAAQGTQWDPQQEEQLQQWLVALLLGHLQQLLPEGSKQPNNEQRLKDVADAARLSVSLCLLLGAQQVLFSRVFPLFQAAGVAGPLLEALEPRILADQLPVLAPEVVQALVEHCSKVLGRPDRVERCVLHLDVTSLDLNQVIRLCEQHRLYSALTYVYNRIGEYRRPVTDMISAAVFAHSSRAGEPSAAGAAGSRAAAGGLEAAAEQRKTVLYKLLVYLRCTFRGHAFPPGSGELHLPQFYGSSGDRPFAGSAVEELKAQLLGTLLFLDTADLAKEWGRPAEQLREAGVTDPHPALQVLLSVDAAATTCVLGEAVEGWDAVETDLRAAAGKPAEELDSVLVATQVLVNAMIGLLGANSLLHDQHHSNLDSVLDFVIQLLAAGRVTVAPKFALQLLQHIAKRAAAAPAASTTTESASAFAAHQYRLTQQQQAPEDLFVKVVETVGITGLGQQRVDPDKMSPEGAAKVLQMAEAAGFLRAAALVHHLQGSYEAALSTHLRISPSSGVFTYIDKSLNGGLRAQDAAQLRSSVLEVALPLIRSDPAAAAELVLRHLPEECGNILARTQSDEQLQFVFLQALLCQQQLLLQQQESASEDLLQAPRPMAVFTGSMANSAGALDLLSRADVAETYVRLLCRFEPSSVLPFLMQGGSGGATHAAYDVRRCIAFCKQYGVTDAQAYLHERLGDLDAAMALHLALVSKSNTALVEVLASSPAPAPQTSSADNVHDARPVTDVHISWLSALSAHLRTIIPRVCGTSSTNSSAGRSSRINSSARPTSLAAGSPQRPSLAASTGSSRPQVEGVRISRAPSVCIPLHESGAGREAPITTPAPPQLAAAWQALSQATGFCRRSSKAAARYEAAAAAAASAGGSSLAPAASGSADFQWFKLMEVYVEQLRVLSYHHQQQQQHEGQQQQGQQGGQYTSYGLRVLLTVFAVFLEEVVGCMADHVPLVLVVQHLIDRYGPSPFGGFRATLLGLFGACAYESNIMSAANRLITKDAYSHVRELYSNSRTGTIKPVKGARVGAAAGPDAAQSPEELQERLAAAVAAATGPSMQNLQMPAPVIAPMGKLPHGDFNTAGISRQRMHVDIDVRSKLHRSRPWVASSSTAGQRGLDQSTTAHDGHVTAGSGQAAAALGSAARTHSDFDVDDLLTWASSAANKS